MKVKVEYDSTDLVGLINNMAEHILKRDNIFKDREDVIDYFYLDYLYNHDFSFSDNLGLTTTKK